MCPQRRARGVHPESHGDARLAFALPKSTSTWTQSLYEFVATYHYLYQSICLPIYFSLHPSFYLSVCLSMYLSMYVSTYLSISFYLIVLIQDQNPKHDLNWSYLVYFSLVWSDLSNSFLSILIFTYFYVIQFNPIQADLFMNLSINVRVEVVDRMSDLKKAGPRSQQRQLDRRCKLWPWRFSKRRGAGCPGAVLYRIGWCRQGVMRWSHWSVRNVTWEFQHCPSSILQWGFSVKLSYHSDFRWPTITGPFVVLGSLRISQGGAP